MNLKIKLSKQNITLLLAIINLLLIVLGVQYKIMIYVAFVLSCFTILFLDNEFSFNFMFILMPFASIFKISSSSISMFTYLQILFCIYRLIKMKKLSLKYVVGILFFFLYLILQSSIMLQSNINLIEVIKIVIHVVFVYTIIKMNLSEQNIKKAIILFSLAIMLSSLLSCLRPVWGALNNMIGDFVSSGGFEGGLVRFSGLYADPNFYTLLISSAILSLLLLLSYDKIPKINYLIVLALSIFGFLTFSKSFILISAIIIVLYLIAMLYNHKVLSCLLVITLGLVLLAITETKLHFLEIFILRMGDTGDLSSVTTGRTDIWLMYLKDFLSNPIKFVFGYGVGVGFLQGRASHNFYIEIIYHIGVIGLLASFIYVIFIVKASKNQKINCINFFIFITIGIVYFFINGLFLYDLAYYLIIIFFNAKINFKKEESKGCIL